MKKNEDWLSIVSTINKKIIVRSFWRRFNIILKGFEEVSEMLSTVLKGSVKSSEEF